MEVARHVVNFISTGAVIVAGYRAVRGELDIFEAMAQLSERGHTLCLPVVEAPRVPLVFRRWRVGSPLEMGRYGIEVPSNREAAVLPDAVLVPLVAFDKNRHRLGYGAGYYDETIHELRKSAKSIQIIGIAFAAQQVEAIPAESHDAKLDAVVTEKGIVKG